LWGREEVIIFLRWTEREFDLPKFELDLFQMNGKALCLLTKNDLAERCPGAGDIIHNVLQLLIRDAQTLHRHLPSSPVTPTSRYPLSPHSHPPTPNWSSLVPPENPFYANHLQHFMAQNSVTLSPAPSIESQTGSPPQNQQETASTVFASNGNGNNEAARSGEARAGSASGSDSAGTSGTQPSTSSGSSSHQSDSEEEQQSNNNYKSKTSKLLPPPINHLHATSFLHQQSPPVTPNVKEATANLLLHHQQQQQQVQKQLGLDYVQHSLFFNSQIDAANNSNTSGSSSASPSTPTTPGYMSVKREFFPDTPSEPNTSKLHVKNLNF
jgi:ETS translocation variant 6/7